MNAVSEEQIAQFVDDCHRVARYGLTQCSSGNLSRRIDGERMLISASRSWLGTLRPDQVVVCRIADGAVLNDRKPSVELGFHAGTLRQRPELNAVLHCQSPCATVVACSAPDEVNFFVLPEIPYYIGRVAVLPYIPPGSPELAQAVVSALEDHNMAVLRNHGQVTVGRNADEALERAVFFELACAVILRAGTAAQPLSDAAAADLMAASQGRRG